MLLNTTIKIIKYHGPVGITTATFCKYQPNGFGTIFALLSLDERRRVMKRLETIHVRLANANRDSLVEDIRKSVASETDIGSVRIYRHVTVATDLSIHIHLETNGAQTEDDSLGARLDAALREYGMVEHSFWTEEVIEKS
jgi:hypothetical protein